MRNLYNISLIGFSVFALLLFGGYETNTQQDIPTQFPIELVYEDGSNVSTRDYSIDFSNPEFGDQPVIDGSIKIVAQLIFRDDPVTFKDQKKKRQAHLASIKSQGLISHKGSTKEPSLISIVTR